MFVYCQVYLHFLHKGCDFLSVAIKRRRFVQSEFSWGSSHRWDRKWGNRVQVCVENEAESSVRRQVGVLPPTGSLLFKGLLYPSFFVVNQVSRFRRRKQRFRVASYFVTSSNSSDESDYRQTYQCPSSGSETLKNASQTCIVLRSSRVFK